MKAMKLLIVLNIPTITVGLHISLEPLVTTIEVSKLKYNELIIMPVIVLR